MNAQAAAAPHQTAPEHASIDQTAPGADGAAEADLFEPPAAPVWAEAAAPGWLRRLLFRLAGVDAALARTCPADEQHQIARVGSAVLFGLGMQATMVFAAAMVILGGGTYGLVGAALLTVVICGVLFAFDTLFVAGDWATQGVAYAGEYGIVCAGGKPAKRWAGIATRWAMSGFIAWVLAVFLLLKLFAPDIGGQLAREYRAANAALIAAASARYDALVADLHARITRADQSLDALATERAQTMQSQTAANEAGQEADLVGRLQTLAQRKAEAEAKLAEYRSSATAELAGAKIVAANSGLSGDGPKHKMYVALADQQAQLGQTLDTAIATAKHDLAALRAYRDAAAQKRDRGNRDRVAEIDTEARQQTVARAALAEQFQALAGHRPAWIEAQLRANPQYTAEDNGLAARIQALWTLAETHPGVATLIVLLKIAAIMLETAGMVTKAFFTQCRVYALCVALRADDACQLEADRRAGWAAWRTRRQDEREAVVELIHTARTRRASQRRGAEMAQAVFEQSLSA